jgi:hypothetical protein
VSTAAPEPAPPIQGWVNMTPCARCGQAIDPTRAVYSKQGELVCKSCESNDLITDGYLRAAKSSCFGALGTGVISIIFNPLYIFSVLAVIQGVRAILLINRREYREVLKSQYASMMVAAIAGTVCGLVRPALFLLAMGAVFLLR